MGSVLTGSRTPLVSRSHLVSRLLIWGPVAIMLAVIARESTESFSGLHTSALLRAIWQGMFGVVADDRWEKIHHLLRKSGHFLGYGTLGLTWLRAWMLTWMVRFRFRVAAAWRGWSFTMAIWCTAVVASLDELHQTWIPDRTGVVQDVLLDTTGALILCSLVALFWLRRNRSEGDPRQLALLHRTRI